MDHWTIGDYIFWFFIFPATIGGLMLLFQAVRNKIKYGKFETNEDREKRLGRHR